MNFMRNSHGSLPSPLWLVPTQVDQPKEDPSTLAGGHRAHRRGLSTRVSAGKVE